MKKTKFLLKGIVIVSIVFFSDISLFANEANDGSSEISNARSIDIEKKINSLSKISGESKEEVYVLIEEKSKENRLSFEEMLDIAYEEYVLTAAKPSKTGRSNITGQVTIDQISVVPMKGDFYYTPADTYWWNHGHAGIFVDSKTVIHAPGPNSTVVSVKTSEARVAAGARFARLRNYSYSHAINAVKYTEEKIGSKYNSSIDNKGCGSVLNCSQLVYCAYKEGAGVYLNNDSWLFVSPHDLVKDNDAKIYYYYK